jgi:hypothetical protein
MCQQQSLPVKFNYNLKVQAKPIMQNAEVVGYLSAGHG